MYFAAARPPERDVIKGLDFSSTREGRSHINHAFTIDIKCIAHILVLSESALTGLSGFTWDSVRSGLAGKLKHLGVSDDPTSSLRNGLRQM